MEHSVPRFQNVYSVPSPEGAALFCQLARRVKQELSFLPPLPPSLQVFVVALLERVRGMQKLSTPSKKGEVTP